MSIDQILVLLGLAALIAAVGDEVARQTSRRVGFAAAGGFLLIAAAPVVPNFSIALGFSLDDVLPLLGLLILVPLVPWTRIRDIRWVPMPGPAIALAGVAILVLAGLISAVLVAETPGDAVRLVIRGTGRMAFLAAITVAVAILGASPRARRFSALAIVAVGTFEGIFGIVAYVIGLPLQAGLEIPRDSSVLAGSIPGRLSGTLGISPNFTGAILMMSIVVTAGLTLAARERRERVLLLVVVAVQGVALVLTYTRVSLGLTLLALVILMILRGRPILLVPLGLLLAVLAVFTPTIERILSDANDRLALWTSAFLLMIDHPFSGVGAGQTLAAVAADPERYRNTVFGTAWSTAHNTVLLAGAEMGVLGAIGAIVLNLGLAVLAVVVLRRAREPDRVVTSAAALALLAFLAQGMVNNLLAVGATGLFAAFLVGSLLLDARGVEAPVMVGDGEAARPRGWFGLLIPPYRRPWRRPGTSPT